MRNVPIALLLFALLPGCNGTSAVPGYQPQAPAARGLATVDTEFTVSGRYIDLARVPLGSAVVR
ncbi:MAG TPA: hypothetical protein VGI19_02285, partial [Candidatus Cybelea sp.]